MRKGTEQMETFGPTKGFVDNPRYVQHRRAALAALGIDAVDAPIVDIVESFRDLPSCFTLQCCCGHFVHAGQRDRNGTAPLCTTDDVGSVTYRIAYVALCLEDSPEGRGLLEALRRICEVDRKYVQLGSADWFWGRQVNSYALQVEPNRYMDKDEVVVDYREALHIQDVRDRFFGELRRTLDACRILRDDQASPSGVPTQ